VAKRRFHWAAEALRQIVRASEEIKRAREAPPSLKHLLRLFNAIRRVTAVLDEVEPLVAKNGHTPGPESRDPRAHRLMTECRRLGSAYHSGLARTIAGFCKKRAENEPEGSPRRTVWQRQSEIFAAEAADTPARRANGRPHTPDDPGEFSHGVS
jgi:hypothetical protein